MKRTFIAAIIVISSLLASVAAKAEFRYGASAGANISSLVFKQKDLVGVTRVAGYQAGGIGEVMFPGLGFGVDFGLFYNQLGAKVNLGQRKVWSSLGYGNERVYLHYLRIPLHLRFKWTRMMGLEDYVAPFVYGGPEIGFLLAHGKCDAFKYATGDLSLACGFGLEIMRRWQLTGSYTWGMTYALKTKLLDDFSARNRYWTVSLSYFF